MKSKPASQPAPQPATTSARRGKIARLPAEIRHEINQRLEDGLDSASLLRWLNGLASVQQILQEHFHGAPVTPQNLSAWRAGGFRDWQWLQEARQLAGQIDEQDTELRAGTDDRLLMDRLATAFGLQLAMALRALQDEQLDGREHWERLRPLLHELDRLRRGGHRAEQLRIQRERWAADQEIRRKQEAAAEAEKERQRQIKALDAADFMELAAKTRGGGLEALRECALDMELRHDLHPGTLTQQVDERAARMKAEAERKAREEEASLARLKEQWARDAAARKARAEARKQAAGKAKTEAEAKITHKSDATATDTNSCAHVATVPSVPSALGQSRLIKVDTGCSSEGSPAAEIPPTA